MFIKTRIKDMYKKYGQTYVKNMGKKYTYMYKTYG